MTSVFKNPKIRVFIALLSLFLLFDMIQDSYAKYVSSANATGNFAIARWAFLVNDQDVLSQNDFSNTIVPVFPGNTYVAEGYIAPNSEGHFEIEIDASDVDVSYQETITLSLANNNTVSDLRITGYALEDSGIITFNGPTTITTNHSLNEQDKTYTYHIYVKWFEGTGETMNNAADTQASANGVAAVRVSVNFLQTAAPATPPTPEPEP